MGQSATFYIDVTYIWRKQWQSLSTAVDEIALVHADLVNSTRNERREAAFQVYDPG